jgi:hypothetical protein
MRVGSNAFLVNLGYRKKISYLVLFALVFILSYSCEKDDICVDGDTPLLIIRFYDVTDTLLPKAAPALRIVGIENGNPVNTFTDRSSLDSVALPLRINETVTSFKIILNSDGDDDVETGNIDTLVFNYETQEVFVSRACGFVANYDNLTELLTADADNWIQNIEIANPSIKSLDSAHVKIFH